MKENPPLESGTLLLREKPIPFVVVRSTKRKRSIGFKIHPKQGLVILAPLRTSLKNLKIMAESHSQWILDKYAVMEHALEASTTSKLITGTYLPYLGNRYPLQINETYGWYQECRLFKEQLHVSVPMHIKGDKREQLIHAKLEAWYREQARIIVQQRLPLWINASGLQPAHWRITSAQHRWGSCSEKNHICINWRLVLAPIELVDYVIVHELCHIAQKNHSRAFWDLVGGILPDYENRRGKLRKQAMHFLE